MFSGGVEKDRHILYLVMIKLIKQRHNRSESKVCTCPYTCVNSNIIAELEGVKLDITILESRLFASISQQESKSVDINSLRVKQKDMEAIINKKDEVICKLNEEIQYIKTKLSSLERGEAQNDLANKGRGLINASNEIPNNSNSKNKDPSQDNNIFNTMDDSFGFTNELPTIMNKNQLSSTIIEIPPSNDEDQHDNLTNATVIVDQFTSPLLAYTKDAPSSKQQGIINTHRNRIPISRLQTQPSNEQIPKSTIPCPFLSRRGWCIKKQNCDFKHPQHLHPKKPWDNMPKYRIRCPFLQRRGFCLKGDQCDFSHSDTSNIPSTQRANMNYPSPFLSHQQRKMTPNYNWQVPPPMIPWSTYPWPKPLMDIPIFSPRVVHQPTYPLHLRPPVY